MLSPIVSEIAASCPQCPQTEVRAGHADPSLSSATLRHGALLSLVAIAGREGRRAVI